MAHRRNMSNVYYFMQMVNHKDYNTYKNRSALYISNDRDENDWQPGVNDNSMNCSWYIHAGIRTPPAEKQIETRHKIGPLKNICATRWMGFFPSLYNHVMNILYFFVTARQSGVRWSKESAMLYHIILHCKYATSRPTLFYFLCLTQLPSKNAVAVLSNHSQLNCKISRRPVVI